MVTYNTSSNNLFRNSPVTAVAASYSALQTDSIISVAAQTAAVTITLPNPSTTGATTNKGKTYYIKDAGGLAGSFNITIQTATPASFKIDGSTAQVISAAYGFAEIYCDGSNYYLVSSSLSNSISGLILVSSQTVSGVSSVSWNNLNSNNYRIVISNGSSSANQPLVAQISTNGGSSYTVNGYTSYSLYTSVASGSSTSYTNGLIITPAPSPGYTDANASVDLIGLTSLSAVSSTGGGTAFGGSTFQTFNIAGSIASATAVNAIQIVANTGATFSGTFALYQYSTTNAAPASGLVYIASQTVSSTTGSVVFSNLTGNNYRILMTNGTVPNNQGMMAQVSFNNGTSYVVSGYSGTFTNGLGVLGVSAGTPVAGASFSADLLNLSTSSPVASNSIGYGTNAGALVTAGGVLLSPVGSVSAIQIVPSSGLGQTFSGTFTLFQYTNQVPASNVQLNGGNVQTFTSSGTYTVSASTKFAIVEMVGGGGGGGGIAAPSGTTVTLGSQGGNGGYAKVLLNLAQLGSSQAVTIGAAGAAGASGGGTGGTGGTTSLGSLISCTGGVGGAFGSSSPSGQFAGGAGGTPTVSTGTSILTLSLSGGEASGFNSTTSNQNFTMCAAGPTSPLGGGYANLRATNGTTAGVSPSGFGAGGSGAVGVFNGAVQAGAAGGAGVVIITEYS